MRDWSGVRLGWTVGRWQEKDQEREQKLVREHLWDRGGPSEAMGVTLCEISNRGDMDTELATSYGQVGLPVEGN